MFLSRHAAHCRLLIRGGDLGKSMSRYLVDQIERNDSIEVVTHSQVVELDGERELETVTIADTRSGERSRAAGPRAVRLHRRLAAHRVARGSAGDRPRRVPADRPRRSGRRPRGVQRRSSALPGDQPPRDLRRRRRPLGLDQARRLGGRRGLDGGSTDPPATGRPCGSADEGMNQVASCTHLDHVQITQLPESVEGCEECLADGRPVAAPADLPRVRQGRMLRRLAQPPRHRSRARQRPPDHPLARAGRGVVLVLRG